MTHTTNNAVEVRNLTVTFGGFKAVDHISFTVSSGEIFGFLGANGAGKTTTIRVLCGLLTPTAGEVRVAGQDPAKGLQAVKEKVGYMSQKFTLYPDMTVKENLSFAASLRKIPAPIFQQRMEELFKLTGFDGSPHTLVKNLPGGLKQDISLIAALLHRPEIVFLDEPTAGVTPAARSRFWELIRRIAEQGKTVFVTTHYMDEAEQCGRIALMREGQIVALDPPETLKKNAFPESLFELSPKSAQDRGWIKTLQQNNNILSLKPYGMRYHAVVKDEKAWRTLASQMSEQFDMRPIQPSLEDVFIRVVEGFSK